jgi:hypothetical protein
MTRAKLPAFALLQAVAPLCEATGYVWGPTGSAGFELASGCPTVTQTSDLDLLMRAPDPLDRTSAKTLIRCPLPSRARPWHAHRYANPDARRRVLAGRIRASRRTRDDALRRRPEARRRPVADESSSMIAFLFPGQGSQFAGFLHTLGGATPHARFAETIEEASDVLHIDVLSLDHADALSSTVAVQLSLLVAGVATVRALQDEGIVPDAVAGLSVGAYGAAVACNAVSFERCLAAPSPTRAIDGACLSARLRDAGGIGLKRA